MEKQQEFHLLPSLLLLLFFISCGTNLVDAGEGSLSSGTSYFFYQQSEYPKDCNEVLSSCPSTHNTSGVYVIKPDGYPEPFEVYCDNNLDSGGWTVLERRHMGLLNFTRQWDEYKTGFGFLGSEFWIGNEKLAFLTNQKQYQLRIDFTNTEGETCYVTYDGFRISDEWGDYSLLSVGNFDGRTELCVQWCPNNTVYSSETCEYSCDDPDTCISPTPGVEERCACIGEHKLHQGNCIPKEQCGCYDSVKRAVIRNGDSYINDDCTRRSSCSNNQLSVDEMFQCPAGSICVEIDGVSACTHTTTQMPAARDCNELYLGGENTDGVYTIYPDGYPGGIRVKCEMESNGGGWTVIQRRTNAATDFYRTWNEYKVGFEDPSQDHWLGNDYIHAITAQKTYSLRIDLTDRDGSPYHALYSSFNISDDTNKYQLSIGSYSGTAGFDAMSWHNNRQFSTHDQDNDGFSSYNCAERHQGAWWYRFFDCGTGVDWCQTHESGCNYFPTSDSCDCRSCAVSNLNGDYDGATRGTNIHWTFLNGYDCGLKFAEMKIKPNV